MYTKKQRLYKKAERILGDKTPLKKDCGLLCGGACCKGDRETGMLLFPGEQTSLDIIEKDGVRLAVCDGKCDREERPLSCRIFPLTPYRKNGRIKLIMNPAAKKMCPLARSLQPSQLEEAFEENVMRAMNRIQKLKDGDDYIDMLTEIADQFEEMNKKLR